MLRAARGLVTIWYPGGGSAAISLTVIMNIRRRGGRWFCRSSEKNDSMTHAMASLERKGWVRREQCPTDRRGQLAVLKDDGMRALATAALGHVAEVKARLFDPLSPAQVTQLREICETLLAGLERSDCPTNDCGK